MLLIFRLFIAMGFSETGAGESWPELPTQVANNWSFKACFVHIDQKIGVEKYS